MRRARRLRPSAVSVTHANVRRRVRQPDHGYGAVIAPSAAIFGPVCGKSCFVRSADHGDRLLLRVGTRQARRDHVGGDQRAAGPAAVAVEGDPDDRGDADDAVVAERPVAGEVAEAVGDQPALVELHAAHDVRAVPDDQVGAGVDHGVRELDRVAAVLAEERLGARPDAGLVGALGAHVHLHDDEVGLAARRLDDLRRGGQVGAQVRPRLVRREPDHRDLEALDLDDRDLARGSRCT